MVSQKPLLLFALCFAVVMSASPSAAQSTEEENPWNREVLAAGRALDTQLRQYAHTELNPHPTNRHIFAANCERNPQWWGRFCVFHQTDGKIDWVAKVPPLYQQWEGMYIVSLHWHHLARLHLDALAVVTSTHMGNGFLWLFALEGRKLRTLLHTPASGYADSPALRDGLPAGITRFSKPITMDIQRPQKGGPELVQFTAAVTVEDNATNEIIARRTMIQMWRWDSKERVFRLRSQR